MGDKSSNLKDKVDWDLTLRSSNPLSSDTEIWGRHEQMLNIKIKMDKNFDPHTQSITNPNQLRLEATNVISYKPITPSIFS